MLKNRVYDPSKVSVFVAGKEIKGFFTDYPISFICGREMIEAFGIHEPKKGCVIYLLHQSEIEDGEWMVFESDRYRLHAFYLPDDIPFKEFIKKFLDNTQTDDYEFSGGLKSIKLEGI